MKLNQDPSSLVRTARRSAYHCAQG